MGEVTEEESVNQYFYGNNDGILDTDVPKEQSLCEDADIITVYLSETDTLDIENVEIDDIIPDDYNPHDPEITEEEVSNFIKRGCGCNEKCSSNFSPEVISNSRNHFRVFDCNKHGRNQLDTVLLGILHAITVSDTIVKRGNNFEISERQRLKHKFLFHGKEICEEFFIFVHGIGSKRFRDLLARYRRNNFAIREQIHANHEESSLNSVPPHEHLVNFLRNFAEDCALFIPRYVLSRKRIIKLLPSEVTKISVYSKYKTAAEQMNDEPVDIFKFGDVWCTYCPDIIIQKFQSESKRAQKARLKKRLAIQRKKENAELFERRQNCLLLAQPEISHYHSVVVKTRENFRFNKYEVPRSVMSFDGSVHLSFDLAQQVHFPSNPQKPNALYFLVPYKVTIFGVMNETCRRQCNYVIPEAIVFPKSRASNSIVSYLHHYLQTFTFGETELYLHGGDCMTQNKNNLVMQYLAWRVARKLNRKITISFLPVNYTKFGPDYAFGLFKMRYRQSVVSCLSDVCNVINSSTPDSDLNFSFLVGDESGRLLMDIFDWQAGFVKADFARIADISKYSHFYFDDRWVGKVKCQKQIHDEMNTYDIFDSCFDVSLIDFEKMQSEGLSHHRKLYLYEKVRPYCSESTFNAICQISQTEIEISTPKKRKLES